MNDFTQLYRSFTMGFSVIAIGAYLGGAWICLAHRRISYWLIAIAVGLVVAALATACGQYAAHMSLEVSPGSSMILEYCYLLDLLAHFLGLGSAVLLVLGLAATLADLRRKLARAMEPKHVRA